MTALVRELGEVVGVTRACAALGVPRPSYYRRSRPAPRRAIQRPRVSNDNPFSESNFHTLKSRPDYPARFGSYEDAAGFCRRTFDWYNHAHHHSGIVMLTPAQVHYGHAEQVLAERQRVLDAAYAARPERFVNGPPKVPSLPQAVWINPPEDKNRSEIKLH